MFTRSCAANQAHFRSHSSPGSGDVFLECPTGPEFQVEPGACRTFVFERLRLPLSVTDATCECGARLDLLGRHRAAISRSGRFAQHNSSNGEDIGGSVSRIWRTSP